MGKYGKWIGGGLGWVLLGGPIGGLFGFAIGSVIDKVSSGKAIDAGKRQTTRGDFALSLLALVAVVLKADGKVLKSELDFVKKYFKLSFGEEQAQEMIILLRDVIKKDIDVRAVTLQIRQNIDKSSKTQLVYFLIELAKADGEFHQNEKRVIEEIISLLGFSSYEKDSLFAMFKTGIDSAYKILETNETATNEEIKKQYKKLAKENHPDKVSYLGDEVREKAKEKFQKIQMAYEEIKKSRGFN
jgi:DnaJ like chaperone protein